MIDQDKIMLIDKSLKDPTFPLKDYVFTIVRNAEYSQSLSQKSFCEARQQFETVNKDVNVWKCGHKIIKQTLGLRANAFIKDREECLALKQALKKCLPMKKVEELSLTDKIHIYLLAYAVYPYVSMTTILESVDIDGAIRRWHDGGERFDKLIRVLIPIFQQLLGNNGKYFSAIKIRRGSFPKKDVNNCILGLSGQERNKKIQEKVITMLLLSVTQIPIKPEMVYGVISSSSTPKPAPAKPEKKSVHIEMKDFFVRSNAFQCRYRLHNIQEVDALVDVLDRSNHIKSIKIAAGYCKQCNVYFIMDSVYKNLKGNGIILCRISDGKDYFNKSSSAGMHLAQESLLMQYGYNVSQVRGLSTEQRQKILALIIDNKIMSRNEIIGYLNFFIRQRKAMPKMRSAVEKWEQDKKYVEKYRVGQYRTVKVNGIKNNKKAVKGR